MKAVLYTDGSSRGNPGPGGWGCVLITEHRSQGTGNSHALVKEFGGREDKTTNNRMEMMALIEGLETALSSWLLAVSNTMNHEVVHGQPNANSQTLIAITVCADSQYVLKGASEWIHGWKKNNWKNAAKKPVLNQDLWEKIDVLINEAKSKGVHLEWKYVRGHAGVELNERADVIATTFADNEPTELYDGVKEKYEAFLTKMG